jgi:hypothetical protein
MMMSAIPGTRRQFRELVDGTIRVMIDIDPPYRKRFLDAFGEIDMAVALVPLAKHVHPGFTEQPPADYPPGATMRIADATKPELKGGELSKLAGKWCNRVDFQEWLSAEYPVFFASTAAMPGPLTEIERAAVMVRLICGVKSRAELDHDQRAAQEFHEKIREPFMEYIGAVS